MTRLDKILIKLQIKYIMSPLDGEIYTRDFLGLMVWYKILLRSYVFQMRYKVVSHQSKLTGKSSNIIVFDKALRFEKIYLKYFHK